MSTDSLCLENIDEFVRDENKIVTCKWLSLTLKIHINQAKRLLYTYLQQQKKKEEKISATYFLAGLSTGENGAVHKCMVVVEDDLDTARSQMTTVTSCHVYSIQRANLKDSNLLYMTDYEGVRENLEHCNKYSSICCKRASEQRTVTARLETSSDKTSVESVPDRSSSKLSEKHSGGGDSSADRPGVAAPPSGRGKKIEPKGSIATMFAQSAKRSGNSDAAKKEPLSKEDAKENKPGHRKGSVMDLFANAKPAAKGKAAEAEKEKVFSDEIQSLGKTGNKVQESLSNKNSRPTEDSDVEDRPEKKRRRRIKNDLFDSSSDEEIDMIVESPVPSPLKEHTPEPEPPHTSVRASKQCEVENTCRKNDKATNSSKLRRRKRKLVPKTYLDNDGFMVTEKVWESESTDASEVEDESKKKVLQKRPAASAPTKKKSPQKKISPVKGKQTSLTSFFKRN